MLFILKKYKVLSLKEEKNRLKNMIKEAKAVFGKDYKKWYDYAKRS